MIRYFTGEISKKWKTRKRCLESGNATGTIRKTNNTTSPPEWRLYCIIFHKRRNSCPVCHEQHLKFKICNKFYCHKYKYYIQIVFTKTCVWVNKLYWRKLRRFQHIKQSRRLNIFQHSKYVTKILIMLSIAYINYSQPSFNWNLGYKYKVFYCLTKYIRYINVFTQDHSFSLLNCTMLEDSKFLFKIRKKVRKDRKEKM